MKLTFFLVGQHVFDSNHDFFAKETRSLLTLFTYLLKFHEIILLTPV